VDNNISYRQEEAFLLQELIFGVAVSIGMLLLGVSELPGILLVLLATLSLAWIYVYRIIKTIDERKEVVFYCFSCLNNGVMILAVAGILMLMLTDAFRRPVFFTALGLLGTVMLLNGFFLRYDIKGMTHITAQLRLVIALVMLIAFYLI